MFNNRILPSQQPRTYDAARMSLFIHPQTGLLRSGWRVLGFVSIAVLPRIAAAFVTLPAPATAKTEAVFEMSGAMIVVYLALVIWVALVSWFCLHFLEGLRFGALGYALHRGWWRDVLLGLAMSVLMIVVVVALQTLSGGTKLQFNPLGWRTLIGGFTLASGLLLMAAVFEEIVFRGYAFQTLLRDVPAVVPMVLLALVFGLAHWSNPNRTLFSAINTALAGVWLAVAYLKTRSLWFPTALHFGWNWTMGLCFGLPISGLPLRNSLLLSTDQGPRWLTGGSYGCEGGVPATIIFALATLLIWRAGWLRATPEMVSATAQCAPETEAPLKLGLNEPA
ncbi:MAG: CPBP family intramembrane metalloprotease [Acidobacteria bacterium]|nr:CPBP family intramembrane metalloprotease [Acidobacteriota bacterium]MBI3421937.1 CPBP family intramembrane metalloprotease [Acidobacteriota bacterium]